MHLVIIEAPGKLKKLRSLLPSIRPDVTWHVEATAGHIRDLPVHGQNPQMPTVGVGQDFKPHYQILSGKEKTVARLKELRQKAVEVYVASDPDREGESIGWHILQAAGIKNYKRVAFKEITKSCISAELSSPRRLDLPKVASQECRRVIDRLVGYLVTPELRRVMGRPTTAGRVQSVAVYLVVLREREIRAFAPIKHFGVELAFVSPSDGRTWKAEWDPVPTFAIKEFPYVQDRQLAELVGAIRNVIVETCIDGEETDTPPAPFISSSLQMAAGNALKWSPDKTMKVAQRLYEQGLITYHRTDNPNISKDSMPDIRAVAKALGLKCVEQQRIFKADQDAQEGHPAITPTDWMAATAGETADEQALYQLIRVRALASQIEAAVYAVRTITLLGVGPDKKPLRFGAKGKLLNVPGWRKLLQGDDAEEQKNETPSSPIPALEPGQILKVYSGEVLEKKTTPPKRFTDASLVGEMKRRGIGRPSSYASIVKNIIDKGQVQMKGRSLIPGELGEATIALLEHNFSFLSLDFTRNLEVALDRIANSEDTYMNVVQQFYQLLQTELQTLCALPSAQDEPRASSTASISSAPTSDLLCGKCGLPLVHRKKAGKGGFDFWGCSGYRTIGCKVSYPTKSGRPDFDNPRGL
ncbi:type I DNA topoisomerase [Pseudomonas aeruginosa]|uniref:type I DNA topoisomerase n=1 Tax=Pseudomonas aeruginosa TaxID=287 RepID=UPI000F5393A9|nr:type I DNA topoisomerase [Pseudomonas aeruginosa]RPY98892.1 DNA topoisomerase I [Pseudomonas aeruginosa]WOA81298.1 type I DNA topoisomerase [Pseudomonas aeruginosa]HDQ4484686.1 type I DNA topoisomerase [Pseudomonas aeruginosa]HDQ4485693.1 type I DNA topoisomerase [Pseudomonas aeruginosa]